MGVMGATFYRRDGSRHEIKHGEAFGLLKYQNKVNGRVEWMWNSRDGVVPFIIADSAADPAECEAFVQGVAAGKIDGATSPRPDRMAHADWHEDIIAPNFVPPLGMRIFMSWADTPEAYKSEAREAWAVRISEAVAAGGDPKAYEGKEPFGYKPTDPCVLTVEESLLAHFAALARDNPFIPPPKVTLARPGLVVPGSGRPN